MPGIHLTAILALTATVAAAGTANSAPSISAATSASTVHAPNAPLSADDLARIAPEADPKVLELALGAMRCAQADGVGEQASRLAVIDYSRSSLEP